jgi:hypothetical protein
LLKKPNLLFGEIKVSYEKSHSYFSSLENSINTTEEWKNAFAQYEKENM